MQRNYFLNRFLVILKKALMHKRKIKSKFTYSKCLLLTRFYSFMCQSPIVGMIISQEKWKVKIKTHIFSFDLECNCQPFSKP